ncbi:uncharacterized protein LOC6541558 [Drosophila erecta]|uniref:MADF domain-containing protein n=1 Tax=Drosophila erecta TaxID=7220 RepID=B3N9F9_DROER|nr:uncharacterized protein LOC6541558 [Drosophila erecta]EDV57416.1 uncharacterized protein Dere_GG24555 [Drosophila erecta]
MKSDNYRLIVEVSKRRCLWDTNMSMAYRNQDAALQWASVAQIMQQDVALCKKRFKGMRDSYRAEVRKIQQKRIEMSHWPYFRSLEFMRHIFDPERLVPFPPEPFVMDTDQPDVCDPTRLVDFAIDVDLDNDDSVDFEIIEDIFQREPSVPQDSGSDKGSLIKPLDSSSSGAHRSDQDLSPTLPMHLPSHQQFLPRPPPPSKRVRRRKTSPSNDGPLLNGYASQATKTVTEADAKNDSDLSFMLSMMPHVKCLSPISNLKFRMEMARVLVELREEDQQMLTAAEPGAVPERGLPKLTPAPNSSFASQLEKNHCHLSSALQSPSTIDYVDSSMIECDVKIENEPLV